MPRSSSNRYLVNRRGFLASAATLIGGTILVPSAPACTLVSEQEVGPYYIDYEKVRHDLTEGKPGVPLRLRIALLNGNRCAPLADAAVDIWHCDAEGVYSGYTANSPDGRGQGGPRGWGFGPPPPGGPPPDGPGRPGFGPPRGMRATDNKRFLRGVQITDKRGVAEFATLYPGWYSGRAIHIHLKVHLGGAMANEKYAGGHVCHTGQLFFPEDLTESVAKLSPYAKRLDIHRTTQEEDHVFNDQNGAACMMKLERITAGSDAAGFTATVALAVNPEATPALVGGFGPGGPRPY